MRFAPLSLSLLMAVSGQAAAQQTPDAQAQPPQPGPSSAPRAIPIVDLLEQELIRDDEARRETLLACSGTMRSRLVQLNQPQAERLYEDAEVAYYVVAGAGVGRVAERELALAAGTFLAIPRGAIFSLLQRGDRPLILIEVLSGIPCETGR